MPAREGIGFWYSYALALLVVSMKMALWPTIVRVSSIRGLTLIVLPYEIEYAIHRWYKVMSSPRILITTAPIFVGELCCKSCENSLQRRLGACGVNRFSCPCTLFATNAVIVSNLKFF